MENGKSTNSRLIIRYAIIATVLLFLRVFLILNILVSLKNVILLDWYLFIGHINLLILGMICAGIAFAIVLRADSKRDHNTEDSDKEEDTPLGPAILFVLFALAAAIFTIWYNLLVFFKGSTIHWIITMICIGIEVAVNRLRKFVKKQIKELEDEDRMLKDYEYRA